MFVIAMNIVHLIIASNKSSGIMKRIIRRKIDVIFVQSGRSKRLGMHNSLISHYYNEKQNKLNMIFFLCSSRSFNRSFSFVLTRCLTLGIALFSSSFIFLAPQRTLFDFRFSARWSLELRCVVIAEYQWRKSERWTMILTIAQQKKKTVASASALSIVQLIEENLNETTSVKS